MQEPARDEALLIRVDRNSVLLFSLFPPVTDHLNIVNEYIARPQYVDKPR
jgi:hypothetical protein